MTGAQVVTVGSGADAVRGTVSGTAPPWELWVQQGGVTALSTVDTDTGSL